MFHAYVELKTESGNQFRLDQVAIVVAVVVANSHASFYLLVRLTDYPLLLLE